MFSALEELADQQNPLNVQAEGRQKEGGELPRVQKLCQAFQSRAKENDCSSPPPPAALSFKAKA